MGKFVDLTGQQFGRLTVIRYLPQKEQPSGKKKNVVLCICECGNETSVLAESLTGGHTRSCGCMAKEATSKRSTTHHETGSKLYYVWQAMKKRCLSPTDKAFHNYGGRGITVCREWAMSFESFRNWALINGYRSGLSIDRIDNNKGYFPDNCRWTTRKVQCNNKRNNHPVTYNGETRNITEWSRITGIPYPTLIRRIKKFKWSIEKALSTPPKCLIERGVLNACN